MHKPAGQTGDAAVGGVEVAREVLGTGSHEVAQRRNVELTRPSSGAGAIQKVQDARADGLARYDFLLVFRSSGVKRWSGKQAVM